MAPVLKEGMQTPDNMVRLDDSGATRHPLRHSFATIQDRQGGLGRRTRNAACGFHPLTTIRLVDQNAGLLLDGVPRSVTANDRQVVIIEKEEPLKVQLRYRPHEPAISANLLISQEINRHHPTVMTRSYYLAPTTVPILVRPLFPRAWTSDATRSCRAL